MPGGYGRWQMPLGRVNAFASKALVSSQNFERTPNHYRFLLCGFVLTQHDSAVQFVWLAVSSHRALDLLQKLRCNTMTVIASEWSQHQQHILTSICFDQ